MPRVMVWAPEVPPGPHPFFVWRKQQDYLAGLEAMATVLPRTQLFPTRHWDTSSSKPGVGGIFSFFGPFKFNVMCPKYVLVLQPVYASHLVRIKELSKLV